MFAILPLLEVVPWWNLLIPRTFLYIQPASQAQSWNENIHLTWHLDLNESEQYLAFEEILLDKHAGKKLNRTALTKLLEEIEVKLRDMPSSLSKIFL